MSDSSLYDFVNIVLEVVGSKEVIKVRGFLE